MVRRGVFVVWCSLLAAQATADTGCTGDGKTYKVGELDKVPGLCPNVCKGNNEWAVLACGLNNGPHGWTFIPEDGPKQSPQCCGRWVPPHDIVPDVLDDLQWSDFLTVAYDSGVKADMGNELTPTQVKNQPEVTYRAEPTELFLLAMVDPDAPSRVEPAARSFKHWLVGNIQGLNVSSGDVLAEYVGSGPPRGSGLHRYVFLLYKQPGKLTFDEAKVLKTSAENRRKFSIQDFAKKYNLGTPQAVNLYQAQFDDYVPTVHAQLGFHPKQ